MKLVDYYKQKRTDLGNNYDILDEKVAKLNENLAKLNIKSLSKEIKKYDYEVPFHALKEDEALQTELIFLTGTFCITKEIPSYYIEEIFKAPILK